LQTLRAGPEGDWRAAIGASGGQKRAQRQWGSPSVESYPTAAFVVVSTGGLDMQKSSTTDLALLILRFALGGIMLAHGLQKVGVVPGGAPNLQATIDGMA